MSKLQLVKNSPNDSENQARIFTLDELCTNPDDPRKTRNPRYDDLKASIRSCGLESVPLVTRDPRLPEGMWTFSNGGNTRYTIMRELWDETGDELFFRMTCVVKPWPGRFQCLAGHLAENETHDRDLAIAGFVPKPWWQVRAQLEKDGIRFEAEWVAAEQYCDEDKRCVNQQIAQAVQQLCQKAGAGSVISAEKKREKTPAPLCFDLGKLQEVCNLKWGFGANEVLSIAQSLYETHKATTYPRTDCGYLPLSMREEAKSVLQAIQQSDPGIASEIARLDITFNSRIWNDKKITAHHAIIPTPQPFDIARLSEKELKVYSLIRLHYLAQFMPLQESDVTNATFNIGNQLFRTRGRVMVIPGWKELFGGQTDEVDEDSDESGAQLPVLEQGSVCQVSGAMVKDNMTKAPQHHTEGTLIAAMKNAASLVTDPQLKKVLRDNAGLGTEATRSGVLETLFKRHYLEKKGKFIHATQMARELIAALPETLTSPGMTALWEQALDDIAQGKSGLSEFMQKQSHWTRHLIEKGKSTAFKVTVPVGPACPECGKPTRQRTGKNGKFWSCTQYPDCKGIVGESNRKNRRKAAGKTRKVGMAQGGTGSAPAVLNLQGGRG